jgi:hypothetical protein
VRDAKATGRQLHTNLVNEPFGPIAGLGEAMMVGDYHETVDIFQRAWPLLVNTLYFLSDTPVAEAKPRRGSRGCAPRESRWRAERPV